MDYKAGSTGAEWRTPPRVCRCCLSEGCYKDISSEYYWMGVKEIYAEMLKECFDLTLTVQETGSNARLICEVCITRLRDASNFKKQVVSSDKRFTEHIKSGASLSTACSRDLSNFTEIKIESIKDEEAVISDDDPPDPDDVDFDDDGYDESDSLPLKFEAQKKESMAELSFGDEMPVLSNTETTIKKVSKVKDNKVLKKLKLNKKELTIKPVKASSSKAKAPKEPRVKLKPAKTAKKGEKLDRKLKKIVKLLKLNGCPLSGLDSLRPKAVQFSVSKYNAATIVESSHCVPFKWITNGFVCVHCNVKFTDPEMLRQHTEHDHKDASIIPILERIKQDLLKIDITRIDCRHCAEPLADLDSLKLHLQSAHGKPVFSQYGDGVIPFRFGGDGFSCHICKKEFNVFIPLNNHMNMHFQHYICETCGKGFATEKRMKSHTIYHSVGDFPCNLCSQVFPCLAMRNTHVVRVHKAIKGFKCPQCELVFDSYLKRNRHRTTVHNEKSLEYKCSMCPKVFALSSKRGLHVRQVHIKEKKHSCSICEWKFFSKGELELHMIKHVGERVHQCDICKKSYARKQTLREHIRIHNNDRKYVCGICFQGYVQNSSRKYHMKVHHPGMPIPNANE